MSPQVPRFEILQVGLFWWLDKLGIGVATAVMRITAVSKVIAMTRVCSLAWEFPHAVGMAKKKTNSNSVGGPLHLKQLL